jgi:hypothetical protein
MLKSSVNSGRTSPWGAIRHSVKLGIQNAVARQIGTDLTLPASALKQVEKDAAGHAADA